MIATVKDFFGGMEGPHIKTTDTAFLFIYTVNIKS